MATIGFPDSTPVVSITTNLQKAAQAVFLQCGDNASTLTASDALDLLDWLYSQRDALFALAHQEDTLTDEQRKIADYNRAIDERNAIAAANREKPWLPLHDGE